MNKIKCFWCYLTLFFLAMACILCIMATPTANLSLGHFIIAVLVSKSLAVLFGWLMAMLYSHWDKKGLMDELNCIFEQFKEKDKEEGE